jgi:hypothetical protein
MKTTQTSVTAAAYNGKEWVAINTTSKVEGVVAHYQPLASVFINN